jgi:hypothetical protein
VSLLLGQQAVVGLGKTDDLGSESVDAAQDFIPAG